MPTLTDEGRMLIEAAFISDERLRLKIGLWLNRVRRMERAFDEICEDARQDELARADRLGVMRPVGNGGVGR